MYAVEHPRVAGLGRSRGVLGGRHLAIETWAGTDINESDWQTFLCDLSPHAIATQVPRTTEAKKNFILNHNQLLSLSLFGEVSQRKEGGSN